MKKLVLLIGLVVTIVFGGCGNDEPVLIINPHSSTYTVGGDKQLDVTFNGLKLTDRGSGVTVETLDGVIATMTLTQIVSGHGNITIGMVELTPAPEGKGYSFKGEMAISEIEKVVFAGTIAGTVLTIDVKTVPL